MIAIRGAIAPVSNDLQAIQAATKTLLTELLEANGLQGEDIVSIIYSATRDLNAAYPAPAARKLGLAQVPMFCVQEMHVQGALEGCIRMLVTVNKQIIPSHIYLGAAKNLRPDWVNTDAD